MPRDDEVEGFSSVDEAVNFIAQQERQPAPASATRGEQGAPERVWVSIPTLRSGHGYIYTTDESEAGDVQYVRADRHVKAIEALRDCLNVMEIQEKRETEEFHLSIETFRPLWDKAKADARAALHPE